MKKHLLLFIFFVCNIANAQIKATITSSNDNSPIPYVNIWIENENVGATSNTDGLFEITADTTDKNIVFSALGFETLTIPANEIKDNVSLINSTEELDEVLLIKRKNDKELIIGEFKKRKVKYSYGCGLSPTVLARYFPYKKEYSRTPILKQIEFITNTRFHGNNSSKGQVNIILYKKNKNGFPGKLLYNDNIIVEFEKGKKVTICSLDSLNLKIPKNGIFIGIQWLFTKDNYYEVDYIQEGEKGKKIMKGYNPSFGMIPMESNKYSCILSAGKWRSMWKSLPEYRSIKKFENKFPTLAMKLHLSN